MNDIVVFDRIDIMTSEVVDILNRAAMNLNRRCNVAVSGGSTPKAIFKLMAEDYNDKVNWDRFSFFWVDERCVPHSNSESNFGEAKRILFDNLWGTKAKLFPINGENVPENEAVVYSETISQNVPSVNSIPQFDVIFLGIGTDGHTASIFPHQIHLFDSPNICELASHPESGQKRITITGKVILNAKEIIFFATGKDKNNILKQILTGSIADTSKYPAALVNKKSKNCKWFLDNASSKFLG